MKHKLNISLVFILLIMGCEKTSDVITKQISSVQSSNATVRQNIIATPTKIAADPDFKAWAQVVKPALDHVLQMVNAGKVETYPGGGDGKLTYVEINQYHYWTRLGLYNQSQAISFFDNSATYAHKLYYRYADQNDFTSAYWIATTGSPWPPLIRQSRTGGITIDELNPWQNCQNAAIGRFAINTYQCGALGLLPAIGEVLAGGCMIGVLIDYMNSMESCGPKRR